MHTRRLVRLVVIASLLSASLVLTTSTAPPASAVTADYARASGDALVPFDDNAYQATWSPDGLTIFFVRDNTNTPVARSEVWRMTSAFGSPTCISCVWVTPGSTEEFDASHYVGIPRISPDGRWLIVQRERQTHACNGICDGIAAPGIGYYNELWVVDLQSNAGNADNAYKMNTAASSGNTGSLWSAWSHSGTQLAWSDIYGGADPGEMADMQIARADFTTDAGTGTGCIVYNGDNLPCLKNRNLYKPDHVAGGATIVDDWREVTGWTPKDDGILYGCAPLSGQSDMNHDVCLMEFSDTTLVKRKTFSSETLGEAEGWDEGPMMSPHGDVFSYMSSEGYGAPENLNDLADNVGDELLADVWINSLVTPTDQARLTFFNDSSHADHTEAEAFTPGDLNQVIAGAVAWGPQGNYLLVNSQLYDAGVVPRITNVLWILRLKHTGWCQPDNEVAGGGNGLETNRANIEFEETPGVFATNTSSTNYTEKEVAYDFNIPVNTGATVNGIQVRVDAKANLATNSPKIKVEITRNVGLSWVTPASTSSEATLTTSEATYTFGGSTDKWSWASVSANDLSNGNFRVRVSFSSTASRTHSVDFVGVKVFTT